MAKDNSELIDVNSDVKDRVMEVSHIQSLIYVIRGKQVMLDSDLAILYQVETKTFNQAVKSCLLYTLTLPTICSV